MSLSLHQLPPTVPPIARIQQCKERLRLCRQAAPWRSVDACSRSAGTTAAAARPWSSGISSAVGSCGFIAANGLLVLVPSAIVLSRWAAAGSLDSTFYVVQAIELIAGAMNFALIGSSIRDGLRLAGRVRRVRRVRRMRAVPTPAPTSSPN